MNKIYFYADYVKEREVFHISLNNAFLLSFAFSFEVSKMLLNWKCFRKVFLKHPCTGSMLNYAWVLVFQ